MAVSDDAMAESREVTGALGQPITLRLCLVQIPLLSVGFSNSPGLHGTLT